ncbi:MAG: Lrp/AsnC ligand binding domain-containing protein, partial [Pelagibacteraceae bacterium]|nr:Lrp/AsnC ligand binding domain-containing protein [Pelagibacteraceae bacterium]
STEWLKKFIKAVSEMDEVIELYRLSGTVDYIFKVLVPSIEKYNEFYKKLTDKIDFFEVTSSFSMEEIKQTSNLPLKYI